MVNGGVKPKISKHGSGGKKKRYSEVKVKCSICGEIFPRAYLAKAHEKVCSKLNTNGDPKPFKCSICGKGFSKKDNMLQHRGESHKNIVEKYLQKDGSLPKSALSKSNPGDGPM